MSDILFGTTIIAAFIGGAVALFAPCCISVMLPAYFATSFQRRRALLTMTLVFGLGISTVILPIAFGASWLTRVIIGHHTLVFLVGGVLMLALGAATISGWRLPLPMPGMQARRDRSAASVFALGAFSGTASACCAPVLAGVVALSGAASSFVAALVVGVAYVFGMVVPLFVIALLWDRYDWGDSAIIRGRTVRLRALGRVLDVHSTALVSGVLLIGMGGIVIALAFSGTAMSSSGWQADLGARLQHYASVALSWLEHIPGSITATAVLVAFGLVVRAAWRQYLSAVPDHNDDALDEPGVDVIDQGEPV
ncbi:MAG: cytochrome c biogenesis CcdA family protein [Acidimicrobiia bacterium]